MNTSHHSTRRSLVILFTWLIGVSAMHSAAIAQSRWTIDDLITDERAGDWTVSRDGSLAAWVKSTVVKVEGDEKRISNLWLTRLASGESIQLTQGSDDNGAPRFSPDGRHIAFISSRKLPPAGVEAAAAAEPEKGQLWIISTSGGEARPITRLDRAVAAFAWADNDTIIVALPESPTLWDKQREEGKDTTVVVDDAKREPPVRLYSLKNEDGSITRLTSNNDWIDSLAVSPDGKWAAVTAQQSLSYTFDEKVKPKLYLVDLQAKDTTMTPLLEGTRLVAQFVQWSPDSTALYFINQFSRHPIYTSASISELHRFDMATRTVTKVELGWDRALGGTYVPVQDGFIALLADGARLKPVRYRMNNGQWTRTDLTGTHATNIDTFAISPDGSRIVYASSSATRPMQGFAARLSGPNGTEITEEKNITNLNKSFAEKPTGRVEIITWKGARDETVEGILSYPLDYKQGQKYPLVVIPHGGPAAASLDQWSSNWAEPFILLRQKGAFTLEPNYHGSSNYGLDWVESIGNGNYYDLEIPDIINGVNHLIAQGLVDENKLGAMGWSNGGILSIDLVTKDHRFKAASVGAADVEWISDWGNVDFGASFDNYYMGGPPWELTQRYIEKSPYFRLGKVTTPTIFHTGTEDRAVPPSQSWSAFRKMQYLEKTPTRLVLYPGEPHGLQKIAHARRKVEEDLAWFDVHLFGISESEMKEAIKDGSMLANLLDRSKAARDGERFGVLINGTLTPETVAFGKLQVGRFEVTRAQFAAFDPAYPAPAGRENHPATGITFLQAQEYVKWLSDKTGKTYRLPSVDEAKSLIEQAHFGGGGGNTLDHWAGYSPNPADVARLLKAIGDVQLLLMPVGSFTGAKADSADENAPAVFDLDGNVAEWAVDPSGKGVLTGPSADRPADAKDDAATPPSEACRGFRVVIG